MSIELTKRIRDLLDDNRISYKEVDHEEADTCEKSSLARGEDLEVGGKAILFKDKKDFRIFVISASLQADSNKIRKILKSQRLRFATKEELMDLAGVVKGALPPFGRDLFPFDLYVDQSIVSNEYIAFNAGVLTKSFIIKVDDYLKIASPTITSFAKNG